MFMDWPRPTSFNIITALNRWSFGLSLRPPWSRVISFLFLSFLLSSFFFLLNLLRWRHHQRFSRRRTPFMSKAINSYKINGNWRWRGKNPQYPLSSIALWVNNTFQTMVLMCVLVDYRQQNHSDFYIFVCRRRNWLKSYRICLLQWDLFWYEQRPNESLYFISPNLIPLLDQRWFQYNNRSINVFFP